MVCVCLGALKKIDRGIERQSVSHPASGCLRAKDQTQEGRDPQGTDPHRGRAHTHRERAPDTQTEAEGPPPL